MSSRQAGSPSAFPCSRCRRLLYPRRWHGANPHCPSVMAVSDYPLDPATPVAAAVLNGELSTEMQREGSWEPGDGCAPPFLLWPIRPSTLPVLGLQRGAVEGPSCACARWAASAVPPTPEPRALGARVPQSFPNPAVWQWEGSGECKGGGKKGRAVVPGLSDRVAEFATC